MPQGPSPALRLLTQAIDMLLAPVFVVAFVSGWYARINDLSEFGLHLWSSVLLAVLVVAHLYLHWRMYSVHGRSLYWKGVHGAESGAQSVRDRLPHDTPLVDYSGDPVPGYQTMTTPEYPPVIPAPPVPPVLDNADPWRPPLDHWEVWIKGPVPEEEWAVLRKLMMTFGPYPGGLSRFNLEHIRGENTAARGETPHDPEAST